ncbi:sulfatase [Niabella terrae]
MRLLNFSKPKGYFLLLLLITVGRLSAQEQPNIVFIISDDHAFQTISAYGSRWMQTPGIDRIAREGVLFTGAYVTNSICGPSRASIMTGKYSHKNGFRDNENSNFNFNQDIFLKGLQQAGYQTAWIGKMHLGDSIPQGFDYYSILPGQGHYYNPDFIETGNLRKHYTGYVSNIITDLSEQWLERRDEDKPFCLVIGHKATHRTWMPDLEDLHRFDSVKFEMPATFYDDYATRQAAAVQDMSVAKTLIMGYDLKMFKDPAEVDKQGSIARMNADQRRVFMGYYDSIRQVLDRQQLQGDELIRWKYQQYMRAYLSTAASLDRNISRVLDYLDQQQLTRNTVVIYMSDQGFYMGEHGWFDKRFMYEESFRTPLVMRYPGVVQPGTRIDDFVMNIDIAPTLLDLAGAQVPAAIQGKSFLPLLRHQPYKSREAMYYHYYENGEHSVSPHFGIRTKRYKLIRFYKRVESWELFDLEKDPRELHNIYDDPSSKKLVADLKARLLGLIEDYDDQEAKTLFYKDI